MTEGRFESTFNVRPHNFDGRAFWAHRHGMDHAHAEDHRIRESAPFHDLRAEGAFQPEYWGHGEPVAAVAPGNLTAKNVGRRLDCGAAKPRNLGCGGAPLPLDTTPAVPPRRAASSKPWGSTKPSKGTFSQFPHMPEGPPSAGRGLPPVAPFGAGKRGGQFSTFDHMPDGNGRVPPPGPSRLAAGKVRPGYDSRLGYAPVGAPVNPAAAAEARVADSRLQPPRAPYNPRNWHKNTLGRWPHGLPDPEPNAHVKSYRPPIFTYHTQTKRNQPVSATWSTGPQTAEPLRPA